MTRRLAPALIAALLVSACSMTPAYERPTVPAPAAFKEEPGWKTAQPADDVAKGEWWKLFGDPTLDALEAKVTVTNQNVAAAAAAYAEARATTKEAQSAAYPTISLTGGAQRRGSFGDSPPIILGGNNGLPGVSGTLDNIADANTRRYSVGIGASWEPDLWGQIRATVSQAKASAQASQAQLANATLSSQGELASNYFQLRAADAQKRTLDQTVDAYTHARRVVENRFREGVAAKQDVLQAEAQLRNARAQAADMVRQRATYEHAIAVLVGENPSSFSLAPTTWIETVPAIPAVLPGDLLQRRPDVAAAERQIAAANANIGIQKAAFFPTIGLSGSVTTTSSDLGKLFTASSSLWSLGAQVAGTLIDFGARKAKVREARAGYDQAVAQYRQIALTAFQQTEDALAANRVLVSVTDERAGAASASSEAARLAFNQYLAGQIDYTQVVTTQTAALSAEQARISAVSSRQAAALSLIRAIGGLWPARG